MNEYIYCNCLPGEINNQKVFIAKTKQTITAKWNFEEKKKEKKNFFGKFLDCPKFRIKLV